MAHEHRRPGIRSLEDLQDEPLTKQARPASIVDMETVMANEVAGDMGNTWLKTNSAGSGPYKLDSWKPNESVT